MLEIIFIIYLARKIGEIVEAKGRKTGWYKFMAVALWIGGEFTGGLVGGVIAALTDTGIFLAYVLALLGAGMGAGIAFLIAKSVSPLQTDFSAPPPPPTFGSHA